jgi:hypothetical protein
VAKELGLEVKALLAALADQFVEAHPDFKELVYAEGKKPAASSNFSKFYRDDFLKFAADKPAQEEEAAPAPSPRRSSRPSRPSRSARDPGRRGPGQARHRRRRPLPPAPARAHPCRGRQTAAGDAHPAAAARPSQLGADRRANWPPICSSPRPPAAAAQPEHAPPPLVRPPVAPMVNRPGPPPAATLAPAARAS